jgi:hypothetical protein
MAIMQEETPKSLPPWRSRVNMIGDVLVVFFVVATVAFVLSALEAMLSPGVARAAETHAYEAVPVSKTGRGEIVMRPQEQKTVVVGFHNLGSETWQPTGPGFVSVYTHEPAYRVSVFADPRWDAPEQPARLSESSVSPGGVGHIQFTLRAPSSDGVYIETFHLAAEDTAWISGGKMVFTIRVKDHEAATTPSAASSARTTDSASVKDGYAATVMIKSAKTMKVKPRATVSYTVGVKNTGTVGWKRRRVQLPGVSLASSTPDYSHRSWSGDAIAAIKEDAEVAPGNLDLLSFEFTAPSKRGSYTAQFILTADEVEVPGGEIEIPIEVTGDAPDVKDRVKRQEAKEDEFRDLMDEPTMRVGVLIVDEETDDRVDITCASDFELQDEDGKTLVHLDDGDRVKAWYQGGRYYYKTGNEEEKTSSFLRFVPEQKNDVCTVMNFDRRDTRNAAEADNAFRHILELRYNPTKDRTWLINELPIEMYLRGLAETSNASHQNFQRALITAARTYALYHFERATKHASEYFHVDAYADQVYNGYGYEKRTPNLTRAVDATRGQVVTFQNKTAITPYFSRSDGRTRSWGEVWNGDVEWLTSVPAPCDEGKTLWGHGVGMSASQALCMANDGEGWKEILSYFYTGTKVTQRWN